MTKKNKIKINDSVSEYITAPNQTIFDIAIDVHGSIDGVADILINNKNITIDTVFRGGESVIFTSAITLDPDTTTQLDIRNIVPTNAPDKEYRFINPDGLFPYMDIFVDITTPDFSIVLTSTCDILVDWGDDSPLDVYKKTNEYSQEHSISHSFNISNLDNSELIRVRVYGNVEKCSFQHNIEIKTPNARSVISYVDMGNVYKFINADDGQIIDPIFILMCEYLNEVRINNSISDDFGFISKLEHMKTIQLNTPYTTKESIDNLFIGIINNYTDKRTPAKVYVKVEPNGVYQKPEDLNNITGMEAVWLLINTPEWNQVIKWEITIDGIEYHKIKSK